MPSRRVVVKELPADARSVLLEDVDGPGRQWGGVVVVTVGVAVVGGALEATVELAGVGGVDPRDDVINVAA